MQPVAFADMLRNAISEELFDEVDKEQVTASFGVAMRSVSESVKDWQSRADSALYRSKHEGRNRVTTAD